MVQVSSVDGEEKDGDPRGRQQAGILPVVFPQCKTGTDKHQPEGRRAGDLPDRRQPAAVDRKLDEIGRCQEERDGTAPPEDVADESGFLLRLCCDRGADSGTAR